MILKKDNKWGYLSYPSQEVLIPFDYSDIEVMNNANGEIKAAKNGKWGLINLDNEILIDFEYEDLDEEKEGMRAFKKDGLWGYMDENGKEVIEPRFNYKS